MHKCYSVNRETRKVELHLFGFFKTFDTEDHRILLKDLDYYGIRGIALRFFESYLANSKQAVKIGLYRSSFQAVVCVVPQGSVL